MLFQFLISAVGTDPSVCVDDDLSICVTNPACQQIPLPDECPEACGAFLDLESLLSPRIRVAVAASIRLGATGTATVVAAGSATAYAALGGGPLQNLDGTEFSFVPVVESASVSGEVLETTVEYTNTGEVVFDPEKKAAFETTLACFTAPFNYSAVLAGVPVHLYLPGIEPSGTSPCTSGEPVPAPPPTVVGCAVGDPKKSRCLPLSACGTNEFQTNPARFKHEDVECAEVSVCGPAEIEIAPPTATSDRVCVPSIERCSFKNGEISGADGCEPIEACDVATEVMVAPPTRNAGPICEPIKACGNGTFEERPRTIEANSECAAIGADCGARSTSASRRAVAISDTEDPPALSFFEEEASTATSDRVCSENRLCRPGEIETAAPTATSGRVCEPAPVPPPPPFCDPYGTGDCEPEMVYRPTLPVLIWNGVVFLGAIAWSVAVNLRETGTKTGHLK